MGRSVWARHSQRRGRQVGREVSALIVACFSFTLMVKRERTSSHCSGVALKVVPMAHAATFTHGCTLAIPGGAVT